jgi:hypothetical protein
MRFAPPLIDVQGELTKTMEVERQAITTAHSLGVQCQAGDISMAEYADGIEREILPAWVERRERLAAITGLPPHLARSFQYLSRYFAIREESWKCLADGLRGDEARMREYEAHEQAARRLEEEFQRQSGK